jgi:hypothetical protein
MLLLSLKVIAFSHLVVFAGILLLYHSTNLHRILEDYKDGFLNLKITESELKKHMNGLFHENYIGIYQISPLVEQNSSDHEVFLGLGDNLVTLRNSNGFLDTKTFIPQKFSSLFPLRLTETKKDFASVVLNLVFLTPEAKDSSDSSKMLLQPHERFLKSIVSVLKLFPARDFAKFQLRVHYLPVINELEDTQDYTEYYKAQILSSLFQQSSVSRPQNNQKQLFFLFEEFPASSPEVVHDQPEFQVNDDTLMISFPDGIQSSESFLEKFRQEIRSFLIQNVFPVSFRELIPFTNDFNNKDTSWVVLGESSNALNYLSAINERISFFSLYRDLTMKFSHLQKTIDFIANPPTAGPNKEILFFVQFFVYFCDSNFSLLQTEFRKLFQELTNSTENNEIHRKKLITQRMIDLLNEMNGILISWRGFFTLYVLNMSHYQQLLIVYGTFGLPLIVPVFRVFKILFLLPKKQKEASI